MPFYLADNFCPCCRRVCRSNVHRRCRMSCCTAHQGQLCNFSTCRFVDEGGNPDAFFGSATRAGLRDNQAAKGKAVALECVPQQLLAYRNQCTHSFIALSSHARATLAHVRQ